MKVEMLFLSQTGDKTIERSGLKQRFLSERPRMGRNPPRPSFFGITHAAGFTKLDLLRRKFAMRPQKIVGRGSGAAQIAQPLIDLNRLCSASVHFGRRINVRARPGHFNARARRI
ncbi:hypothetical protein RZS28_03220 [Methylocapsa polymorpha]|uniref:Uncharacterized protein n=1 Tax=Methylocapsa polymorpha TaxID=3080828 RepID=A0ABZ0HSN9_9HYPH|nr:hypothetical protein RZS28_03220 [Methylocapsa sp. RX1]